MSTGASGSTVPARPRGEFVWIQAAETGSIRAASDLARRLVAGRIGLSVLLTTRDTDAAAQLEEMPASILIQALPSDHPARAVEFLDHWLPDAVVWLWGDLQPNLLLELGRRDVPLILADAGRDGFDSRRDRWLPEVPRTLIAQFDHVLARSDVARDRLTQLGRPAADIQITHPLRPTGQVFDVIQSDLDELTRAVAGRPVWLAADISADEVPMMLDAHAEVCRMSHRLLLVLRPRDPGEAETIAALCAEKNLRALRWIDGNFPDDLCQVVIADTSGEMGLWYRIAPVVFLGHSLIPGLGGSDPYPAAAHGAAVIFGPYPEAHAEAYERLKTAGAARMVRDIKDLRAAIGDLLAPDRAAAMALAGWDVISEGTEAMDRIFSLLNSALDAREQGSG